MSKPSKQLGGSWLQRQDVGVINVFFPSRYPSLQLGLMDNPLLDEESFQGYFSSTEGVFPPGKWWKKLNPRWIGSGLSRFYGDSSVGGIAMWARWV